MGPQRPSPSFHASRPTASPEGLAPESRVVTPNLPSSTHATPQGDMRDVQDKPSDLLAPVSPPTPTLATPQLKGKKKVVKRAYQRGIQTSLESQRLHPHTLKNLDTHLSQVSDSVRARLAALRPTALLLPDGTTLTASSHVFTGGFGAVGFGLDAGGEMFAIKTMRTREKAGAKTQLSDINDIQREFHYIQQYFDPQARLFAGAKGKVILVTRMLYKNAHELSDFISAHAPLSDHVAFVRYATASVLSKLAEMHAHDDAFLDLKPANVMVGYDGDIRLCDFGKASPLHAQAWLPATASFAAPELIAPWADLGASRTDSPDAATSADDVPQRATNDLRSDMWSAGMTAIDMLVPVSHGPFGDMQGMNAFVVLADFVAWHSRFYRDDESFNMAAMRRDAANPFSTYFAQVAELDTGLCQFVLERLLVPNVERRAHAAEAATAVVKEFLSGGIETGSDAQSMKASIAKLAAHDPLRRLLQAVLETAQEAGFKKTSSNPPVSTLSERLYRLVSRKRT